MEVDLLGFSASAQDETSISDTAKKKAKKGGGFQAMGLNALVLKGVKSRGYKLPTPIQRKSIPLCLEGRDVVAMARTGSGKTACFVLPMLHRLLSTPGKGTRALILTPTRELALQTLKFIRELGKFTGLKATTVLGGDSMEQQFSVMHSSRPDIVVATPGRFLHLCVEMELSLDTIEMVVFDEGDRLFELGFGEQLKEVLARLPSCRQTVLFSATLPSMLVEFARAGLSDPILLRLDVEWKLPPELWLGFVCCRSEQREAALLLVLQRVLATPKAQAVVFTATRHHTEYLHLILSRAGIDSACIYSGLESSARKIAVGRFSTHKCPVLLVTDVAARGLDLPALDTVVNYHFPAKPKLFVHRVGRSARAGRSGRAISLVSPDDVAHLLDLHLFLGSEPVCAGSTVAPVGDGGPSGVWGALPPEELDVRHADVIRWQHDASDITDMQRVCRNAWGQYLRCRESASSESNKRAKLLLPPAHPHPLFLSAQDQAGEQAADLLQQMKSYRPKGTILELGARNDAPNYIAMKAKRLWHQDKIKPIHKDQLKTSHSGNPQSPAVPEDSAALRAVFPTVLGGHTKFDEAKLYKKKKRPKEVLRDPNYIPHQASDRHTEMGLAVNFGMEAQHAALSLAPDNTDDLRRTTQTEKWDRRRKKMMPVQGQTKLIRTEAGHKIPATYRSGRYQAWKSRNITDDGNNNDEETDAPPSKPVSEFRPHWMKHEEKLERKKALKANTELKTNQQILKERLKKQKNKAKMQAKGKGKGKGRGKPRGKKR